jgi:hypothetical protein
MVRFHVRKVAFFLGLAVIAALVLAAVPAQAQLWVGPAALELRVKDSKGLPVAGAEVRLQLTALEPRDGPEPVRTDERGRAAAGGLAEGVWSIEVSREGFMTYQADVAVREGGRPDVIQATQMQVPGATRLLEVEVYRSRAPRAARATPPPPRPRETRPAPREEPRPAPQEPAPAPAQPAPQEPAPVPAQPAPAPAPRQTPPPPEPAPETPRPAPAPPAAPAPAPVTPQPVPAPAPPAAAAPLDTVRQRSSRDRTCPECPAGEASLSVERVLPAGTAAGSCGGDIESRLRGGEVPAGLPAGCHVLGVNVPAGNRYTAYRFEIQDGGASRDCIAGQDCPVGAGRWPVNPVLVRRPEGTLVLAPFEAGASDRERRVVLTVYYATGRR